MHRLYNLFKIAQLASGRARIPKPGLIDSRGCVLHLCDTPYVYRARPLIQNVYFRMHFLFHYKSNSDLPGQGGWVSTD